MIPYPSINMDPKLLRKGGRKAPRITQDELRKHYSDFCKKHASDWDRDDDCNGFEEMANEYWEVSDEQHKKWFNSPRVQALTKEEREKINDYHDATPRKSKYIPPVGPIKFNKFNKMGAGPAYRIANGYPVTHGDINWDAILEDIKHRIVVTD